ncbi:MAG: putative Signal transduction histidine kinase, partial [Pseudonocardiales bacterium]|nr:putative Signal transduction histidine kinase [Pseudonocardiales bacterium]
RIVQELLSNAVLHAGAQYVRLVIEGLDGAVEMTVDDDGGGFDPTQAAAQGHFGLALVRDLVSEIGGTLQVRSGLGTTWLLTVPIR